MRSWIEELLNSSLTPSRRKLIKTSLRINLPRHRRASISDIWNLSIKIECGFSALKVQAYHYHIRRSHGGRWTSSARKLLQFVAVLIFYISSDGKNTSNQNKGQSAFSIIVEHLRRHQTTVSCSSSLHMAHASSLSQNMITRLSNLGSIRRLSTSATQHSHPSGSQNFSHWLRPAHTPVYVVLGMVLMAVGIGIHTAKQQIMHSPDVKVSKKKRESIMEVDDPDQAVASADKYINNSFFRKVDHVQEHRHNDPTRPDPFTKPPRAETLKSVGVDPKTSASD